MSHLYVNKSASNTLIRLTCQMIKEVPALFFAETSVALVLWQARPGMIVTAVDRDGEIWRARILDYDGTKGLLLPFHRAERSPESVLQLTVYQAIPEKERFELILEKLTELGVSRIVPVVTSRSATIAERDEKQQKSHRWPDVIRRAACQCRRAIIPPLSPCMTFSEVLADAQNADLRLLLYEGEGVTSIKVATSQADCRSVALLVGPEGGFTFQEVETARHSGFLPVSLGPRILRTETAAISATTVIQFALGDLY